MGLFKGDRFLWLNHNPVVAIPHRDHLPAGLRVEPNPNACGEDDPIYSARLQRDGWRKVQDWKYRYIGHGFTTDQPEIREKTSRRNRRIKLVISRSISVFKYKEDFSIVGGDQEVAVRADWADWDYKGRLVFARNGHLFVADLRAFPDIAETEVLDLNPLKPEPCAAPDWAQRW